jgi:hypothetical protein
VAIRGAWNAEVGGKWERIGPDGWIIEPRFDAAGLLDADSAFVTIDGMTGVLKLKDQSWVVPPRPGVMCDVPYGIRWQSKERRAILSKQGESWVDIEAERMGVI